MKIQITLLLFILTTSIIYGQTSELDNDKLQLINGFNLFNATASQMNVGSDLQKSTLNESGLLIQQLAVIPGESSQFGINELNFTKAFSGNTNQWDIQSVDNGNDRTELRIFENNTDVGLNTSNPFSILPHNPSLENHILMDGLVGINTSTPGDGIHIKQKNDDITIADLGALRLERNATTDSWTMVADALGDLTFLRNGICIAYIDKDTKDMSPCGLVALKSKTIERKTPNVLDKVLGMKSIISSNAAGKESFDLDLNSIQNELPSLIVENRGQTSYKKSELSVLAIKAIQEQQSIITELQLQNDELIKRLELIESALSHK